MLLSSSVDMKVMLWDTVRMELLNIFSHNDIVSGICFFRGDNNLFVSGCFDKTIRIWNISKNKVVNWVQANDIVTAVAVKQDENILLAGLLHGEVIVYKIEVFYIILI